MKRHFTKRRYYLERADYRLEQRFQAKSDKVLPRSRRAALGHDPRGEEHFPPEYPFGLDDDEDDGCPYCGCACNSDHEEDESE